MTSIQLGEIAALSTALFFSAAPTFFTLAGRRVGSVAVNRVRLLVASLLVFALHWTLVGTPLPLGAAGEQWFWLSLSGVIGLVAGDACLFQALLILGARLTMLVFSLTPILAAILARLLFGEILSAGQMLGVLVTLGGVAWVVLSHDGNGARRDRRRYAIGLLLAVGGSTGQALGMITAKLGLDGELPALSAHLIRLGSATLTIWILAALRGRAAVTWRAMLGDRRALAFTASGAALGPLFGVWLSLVAIGSAPIGIATTLMALPPVFLLPIGRLVFGERITVHAVLGTLVAITGVALLFLLA